MSVKPWMELGRYLNPYLGIRDVSKPRSEGSMTNMTHCFTVLDNARNGFVFLGCYSSLDDAKRVANENCGADILKCAINGAWRALTQIPRIFVIKQHLALTADQRTRHDKQYSETILGHEVGIENAERFIRRYCLETFFAPDDVRVKFHSPHHVEAEIYTQRLQKPPNMDSYMLGGFYVGTIRTEVAEYDYVCENAPSTNN